MTPEQHYLEIEPLPPKYDKVYRASNGEDEAPYEVNLARLECNCPEFNKQRAAYPPRDARRVCDHIYGKLCSTKVERNFSLPLQLFIRYGRGMHSYRMVPDSRGVLVIGQPFGLGSVRAIGEIDGKPILATYNFISGEWSSGESDLKRPLASYVLSQMQSTLPEAFRGGRR